MSVNDLEIKKHPNDIDLIHEYKMKDENFYEFSNLYVTDVNTFNAIKKTYKFSIS